MATDSKGERHFVAPKFPPSFKDTIKYDFINIIDPVSKKEGVKGIHYLTARQWGAGMDGYVEGEHPNDFGMVNLAAGMTKKLRKILK